MEDRVPPFLKPKASRRATWKAAEKRDAKGIGGRVTPGSGSGGIKGDSLGGDWKLGQQIMVESKSTSKKSFSIKLSVLRKLEKEAAVRGYDPMLMLTFTEADRRYAIVPASRMEELLDIEAELLRMKDGTQEEG